MPRLYFAVLIVLYWPIFHDGDDFDYAMIYILKTIAYYFIFIY